MSRLLSHQRRLSEVRSATQPLGSPQPLERARLASRLGEVNDGFHQLADGAGLLQKGLTEGAAKLRAAIWLEETTGLTLDRKAGLARTEPKSDAAVSRAHTRETLASGLKQASAVLQWSPGMPATWNLAGPQSRIRQPSKDGKKGAGATAATASVKPRGGNRHVSRQDRSRTNRTGTAAAKPAAEKPQETLLRELTRAAAGRRPDRRRRRAGQPRGHRDPQRSGRPPRPGSPADRRPDRARQPRAAPQLRRLHHARRPPGPDRPDPGRPHVLSRRDGPGLDPAAPAQRLTSASIRAFTSRPRSPAPTPNRPTSAP